MRIINTPADHRHRPTRDFRPALSGKIQSALTDGDAPSVPPSKSGYRAHFRSNFKCGLASNSWIVEMACRCLNARLPNVVGRELDSKFQDLGEVLIEKNF
jgi:hypothetical protein